MFIDAWLSLEMLDPPEEARFKKLTAYPSCQQLLDSKWWGFMFTSSLHAGVLADRDLHGDCAFCHKHCQFKCSAPPPSFVERTLFPINHLLPLALIILMSLFDTKPGERVQYRQTCSIEGQAFLRLFLSTSSLFVTLFVNLLSAAKEASYIRVQRCIDLWVKQ